MSANIASPRRSTTITTARLIEPLLIDTEALRERLQKPSVNLRLIHVGDASSFARQHLPGALLVEPRELVAGTLPATGRLPEIHLLSELFSRLGYTEDAEFIVYDDEGGGWAGRFAWTLDVIGHRSWCYLDGGIHAWAESADLAAGSCQHPPSTDVQVQIDRRPIAEIEDVLAAIEDPCQTIWDVRSRDEYLGLRSGSNRAGHIPTACHLDWLELKDATRATRLTRNLQELLSTHGIDGRQRIITHCQTHHRSGLSYMVGRLLGFTDIRAYHGSWAEWGNRDDLPVEQGP
jgi:thiosulfate/3-mercaptopyruvate sulfurtransferase